jgi:quercetin dioxygenase-like cupin family protein
MIRKKQEQRLSTEHKLKGGKGDIGLKHFLEEAESYGNGRLFAISIIPPGCSIGYHTHAGDFEIYYILKGTAKVSDNGIEDILHPGDSMTCREGESHSIENIGDSDLEYVAIILYTEKKEM